MAPPRETNTASISENYAKDDTYTTLRNLSLKRKNIIDRLESYYQEEVNTTMKSQMRFSLAPGHFVDDEKLENSNADADNSSKEYHKQRRGCDEEGEIDDPLKKSMATCLQQRTAKINYRNNEDIYEADVDLFSDEFQRTSNNSFMSGIIYTASENHDDNDESKIVEKLSKNCKKTTCSVSDDPGNPRSCRKKKKHRRMFKIFSRPPR